MIPFFSPYRIIVFIVDAVLESPGRVRIIDLSSSQLIAEEQTSIVFGKHTQEEEEEDGRGV